MRDDIHRYARAHSSHRPVVHQLGSHREHSSPKLDCRHSRARAVRGQAVAWARRRRAACVDGLSFSDQSLSSNHHHTIIAAAAFHRPFSCRFGMMTKPRPGLYSIKGGPVAQPSALSAIARARIAIARTHLSRAHAHRALTHRAHAQAHIIAKQHAQH